LVVIIAIYDACTSSGNIKYGTGIYGEPHNGTISIVEVMSAVALWLLHKAFVAVKYAMLSKQTYQYFTDANTSEEGKTFRMQLQVCSNICFSQLGNAKSNLPR
jgi:hypothetical protein